MINPLQIHAALQSVGIKEATFHFDDGDYYYIALDNKEFQLSREGDVPTNYIME